jgi:hypothetical protein
MLCFTHPESKDLRAPRGQHPLYLSNPGLPPGRERLRHLIMGSPEGVRSTIHTLHVLRYAEQSTWSRLLQIPTAGILLTPVQGEVFSYLWRDRPLS